MSDNIVDFRGVTFLDMPPERIICRAEKHNFQDILILGYDDKGEFVFLSSKADGGDVLWLLELAKKLLLEAIP